MAVINKIKAGNIQLGTHPPIISCAPLVVYSGPGSDQDSKEIYVSEDDSVEKSDLQSADSTGLQPLRCMVPQSSSPYPYR